MTCLLELAGIALGAAIDSQILREYPRFLPFCIAVGCIAAVLLTVTLWIGIRKKSNLSKRARIVSCVAAALLSVPLIAGWSALFDSLQTRL